MKAPAFLSVNGRRTRVRVEGDPADPPVLLHGIGRSLEDWAPQYPRLARGYRLIALDLTGFGFSDRSPGLTTLDVPARGVIDTLDALGERRPLHVLGNSLGGAIAQRLLALDSERVDSLALVGSAGFGPEVALALRLLALPVLDRLATRRTTRMGTGTLMTERLMYADPAVATKERVDHALAIASQPGPSTVLLESLRELATVRGTKPGRQAELASALRGRLDLEVERVDPERPEIQTVDAAHRTPLPIAVDRPVC